jgi:hypothetical protein
MLLGCNSSGKSTSLKILQEAINSGCGEFNEVEAQIFSMNPKSMNCELMFGYTNKKTDEWINGVLP